MIGGESTLSNPSPYAQSAVLRPLLQLATDERGVPAPDEMWLGTNPYHFCKPRVAQDINRCNQWLRISSLDVLLEGFTATWGSRYKCTSADAFACVDKS